MKLVVVIPAFNEEKTIAQVISGIPSTIPGVAKTQVVVVDDGSQDRTSELAEQAGATVVRHPENRGVGAAFVTGIKSALAAGADCIVNIDADGQFNPGDISKLIDWSNAGLTRTYGANTGAAAFPSVAAQPVYVIELVSKLPPSAGGSVGIGIAPANTGGRVYRVTVLATGARAESRAILQSAYIVRKS